MSFIDYHGMQLFYLQRTSGRAGTPSALLLHGAGGIANLWGRVLARRLEAECYAPDLPGHGRSVATPPLDLAEHCSAALALADALRLDTFFAFGHSMGAAVALALALRAPERVRGLALVSATPHLVMPAELMDWLGAAPQRAAEWIITHGYGPAVGPAERKVALAQLLAVPPQVLAHDLAACAAFDVTRRLAEVRCPTLVVCGEADEITPLAGAQTLQMGIPGATLQVIAGAGHMLPLERPEELAAALDTFLKGTGE